ncbi:MAG: class I SAM-dependent methyltransferase [Gammaproteobacteria bacterium]
MPNLRLIFSVLLMSLALTGCDSASEQAESPASDQVAIDGFFSDLPRFYKIDSIRTIGARKDAPLALMERLNIRHQMIIEHHADLIKGAKILDFGSYDGRWTYAALEAGAEHVTGIEINQDFVDQAIKNLDELEAPQDKYDFIVGDLLEELRKIEPGEYDGILNLGIFYHITYHVALMEEMQRLNVDWIILDSSVQLDEKPIVQWSLSPYGMEGTPSVSAIDLMANQYEFSLTRVPLPPNNSFGMWDYNEGGRATFTMLPGATKKQFKKQ